MPSDSTARYAPDKALAEVTAYSTPKCTDSARGAFCLETYYGPYWNYTPHQHQPSTQDIWTTGYEIRYAPTLPHADSCNNSSEQKPSYSFTTTTTYNEGSLLHCARLITLMSYIWTCQTSGTQLSKKISPSFGRAPRELPASSNWHRTVPHAPQSTICKSQHKPTVTTAVSLYWHTSAPPNPGYERTF